MRYLILAALRLIYNVSFITLNKSVELSVFKITLGILVKVSKSGGTNVLLLSATQRIHVEGQGHLFLLN